MLCIPNGRIQRSSRPIVEHDGRHAKSVQLTVCTPNHRFERPDLKDLHTTSSNLMFGIPDPRIQRSEMQIVEFDGLHDACSAHHCYCVLLLLLLLPLVLLLLLLLLLLPPLLLLLLLPPLVPLLLPTSGKEP